VLAKVGPFEWDCEMLVFLMYRLVGSYFLFCRPNGVRFTAASGSTEFIKRWDPKPGDVVSFKHRGFLLATKKPKLPLIYRIRSDLKWEDVLENWTESKPIPSE